MDKVWKGAREFLTEVFAHRDRQRDQTVRSFRIHEERGDFTSILPDQSLHLFERRNVRR